MPSVAVAGGSLGGLTAALVLRDAGCDATVYERSATALDARGAGIAVLDQTLRYPVERLGIPADEISTSTEWVRFLRPDGEVGFAERRSNRFSAWNTIYRVLHEAFGDERYEHGRELVNSYTDADRVHMDFVDGSSRQAGLLVCADGIGSPTRGRLLPDVAPRYAGYVAWRGTVPKTDLSESARAVLTDAITYQVMPGSHILVYAIPGPDGSVRPGKRLFNMVWYRNVDLEALPEFLTDRTGVRREVSLPPGSATDDHLDALRADADALLAPAITEMVTSVPEPFVQAVFDISVDSMTSGRTCLLGDAAFAVRPHAAAGTAKAAEDGWVLAEELLAASGDVPSALARWENRQLALGRGLLDRTREIGDLSQFGSGLSAGDPRLVFGLYGPGQ